MITFVVNLHPGIPGMAHAEPFLYSLINEEKIQLIFPTTASVSQRLEQSVMEVRKTLERRGFVKWQVVFLINIDARQQSPYRDSISAQMLLIRKLFLEAGQFPNRPAQTRIIALDQVNEDEAIPSIGASKSYKECWELDAFGYIRSSANFITTDAEMMELDSIWRRINLDNSIVINNGFSGLPQNTQQDVMQVVNNITQKVEEMLQPSKLQKKDFNANQQIAYIDEQVLLEIKNEFFKRLETTKNDPTRYANFLPSGALKICFSEQFGIFALKNDLFRLMRLPFFMNPDVFFQKSLLKLSFLLTLIAEQEDIIVSLSGKNYTVTLSLNEPELIKLIGDYWVQLYNFEVKLNNRYSVPPPIKIKLFQNNNCGCTEVLEKVQSQILQVEFLRTNGDVLKWNEWNKELKKQLEDYSIQAKRKIQNCINAGFKSESDALEKPVDQINNLVEDLERQRQTLQEEAKQNFLSKAYHDDWDDFSQQQEGKLKPLLFSRPSMVELTWIVIVSIIILGVTFTNVYIRFEPLGIKLAYYALVLGFMLAPVFLAIWLAGRKHRKDIRRILQYTFDGAQERRTNINNEFDRQKVYLKSLCNLNVVRGNYDRACKAQLEQQQINILYDFHRRNLQNHKNIASKILNAFGKNTNNIASEYNQKMTEPDINLPPSANLAYMPVSYIFTGQREEFRVGSVENTTYVITSKCARLISMVSFSQDLIYTKDTLFHK